MPYEIRPATQDDHDAVSTLLARSYRALLAPDYPAALLREALPLITRANPGLLRCGTYFVAVDPGTGRVLAAGGWTDISPAGHPGRRGEGHIRHVATDPEAARRGLGRDIMRHVVRSAAQVGVTRLHCLSTLTARPFYGALGFGLLGGIVIRLAPGVHFPAVHMRGEDLPAQVAEMHTEKAPS